MQQVLPHPLWLGHAGDGCDSHRIVDAGIRAVVQLAVEEPALQVPRDLILCHFPLVDGAGNDRKLLSLAVTTVANLLEKSVPTLVCCGAGMSRSPAVAAAALSLVYQEEPEECLKTVTEHHPHDVQPGLWAEVKALLEGDRF